jgi:hypothetical protein
VSRGLVLFGRLRDDDTIVYVLAEFDTETGEQTEILHSMSRQTLMAEIEGLQHLSDYDAGVIIDLSSPI